MGLEYERDILEMVVVVDGVVDVFEVFVVVCDLFIC